MILICVCLSQTPDEKEKKDQFIAPFVFLMLKYTRIVSQFPLS